jgi:hypothetical protein
MKKIIVFILIVFSACSAVNAADPAFGYLKTTMLTGCAHTSAGAKDWQCLSPLSQKDRWQFRIMHKDNPSQVLNVTGLIEYTKAENGKNYYFYGVPLENKGNLVRFDKDGAYIKNLKFPVFSFIFLDVELQPEIHYLKFPPKIGEAWTEISTGVVKLLGLFPIKVQSKTKFMVDSQADVLLAGKPVHVYIIKSEIDRGDGKIFKEETWYGEGVGLMYSDTETYTMELLEYIPGKI